MRPTIAIDPRANLIGSAWMIASMAAFAIEDAVLKSAAFSLPLGQILIIFGLGGALIFALTARANGQPLYTSDVLSPPMRIRVVFEVLGRLFYILSLSLIPLSSATVILQATPLVVVAGAALIFGEQVGWRRWSAIVLGGVGVLIILQPGTQDFSLMSLFAILGMLGFAGRDLASRAAPAALTTAQLGVYGFLAIVLAGVILSVIQGTSFAIPTPYATLFLTASIFAGVTGYSCLMKAMRTGEVGAVTPFRYTRLIFGIAIGVVFFGETLSPAMLFGSALIVCSGLFILKRAARR